jgi:hypothetical protein
MHTRISRLVLGAWDPKAGAHRSVRNIVREDIVRDRRATHRSRSSAELVGRRDVGLPCAGVQAQRS